MSGVVRASQIVFHIADGDRLLSAKDRSHYRAHSFDTEGFIHCCTEHQLAGVVSRYYQGIENLTLLVLDGLAFNESLVMENTVGGSELFPHIYSEIPWAAVIDTLSFNTSRLPDLSRYRSN
ncbi:MAG: DUF952 domain-containing protein [Gammaproteobacteria bacterium]|nr:DUF952 domain-containing protein [Gammaproteobacteria bacterium]